MILYVCYNKKSENKIMTIKGNVPLLVVEVFSMARKGKVIEEIIHSNYLGSEQNLIIYTPEHYSPLYSYPVLFLQDGEDYFKLGKITSTVEKLIDEGLIGRCILVGIPVQDKQQRNRRYRADGEEYQAYLRFVGEELVSYIDTHYATHPIQGARALAGDSLGGSISLDIALAYPYTFHHVIAQSGAFYLETQNRIKQFKHSPSLLSLYLSVGTNEQAVTTSQGSLDFLQLNQETKALLEASGFQVHYTENDGDHTWGQWQKDLYAALQFIWAK